MLLPDCTKFSAQKNFPVNRNIFYVSQKKDSKIRAIRVNIRKHKNNRGVLQRR